MAVSKDKVITPVFSHPTLGGKSSFDYTFVNGSLLLRFGRMNYFLVVKKEIIDAVKQRVLLMKETQKDICKIRSSLYNKPKWQECPNNRFSVYVACLIIHDKIIITES